jgi:gluconolactonase
VPDGIRLDTDENVWTSSVSNEGAMCVSPDGKLIGRIHVPEPVSNLCYGGPKPNRLFITAGPRLFAIFTGARGISTLQGRWR